MSETTRRVERLSMPHAGFRRLIIVAVILGFTAVLLTAGAAVWATVRGQELTAWVAHSTDVQADVARLRIAVEQAEAARRGYMLTRDPRVRTTFMEASAQADSALRGLVNETRDNPDQSKRLTALEATLASHMNESLHTVQLVAMGGQAQAIRDFQAESLSTANIRAIREQIIEVAAAEQRLLISREAAQDAAVRNLYLALGVAVPLLLIVAIGSTFVIFRYTRDLSESSAALRKLNEGLEEAVAERTANLAMANEEIQRFAYIVSHDLRAPLVNIMGFTAELETSLKPLTRQVDKLKAEAPNLLIGDAELMVREEVPEALGFIRKSSQKMDRLINAILQLSRSGRRPVKPEPLELSRLLSDVAATLKTAADEGAADIIVAPDLPRVVSDRLALEQVFANLIENGIKYQAPGRPSRIEVTGGWRGGLAEVAVTDNGRGIDPRDAERIFELFRRAGVQDQPGEGIGLAAVRATVHRLGGSITCDSRLDEGATFRVLLPAVLRTAQEPAA